MASSLEPSTFRMPISLLLRSAVKADKPNNPKEEMSIASPAKPLDNKATRFSAAY